MAMHNKPMTLIESEFNTAMSRAPDSMQRFIADFSNYQKSYVKSLVNSTTLIFSDQGIDILSRMFAFEIMRRSTIFTGLAMDKIDEANEQVKGYEWLATFAPESYKLMAMAIKCGQKDSLERQLISEQMTKLCDSSYPEAQRRLLMVLGFSGEELDYMIDTFAAAEFVAKVSVIAARMQRR